MVAKMTGASLGFLAFTVAIVAGIAVGNPVNVTLSRSIYALLIFTVLGLLLGGVPWLLRIRVSPTLHLQTVRDPREESAGGTHPIHRREPASTCILRMRAIGGCDSSSAVEIERYAAPRQNTSARIQGRVCFWPQMDTRLEETL